MPQQRTCVLCMRVRILRYVVRVLATPFPLLCNVQHFTGVAAEIRAKRIFVYDSLTHKAAVAGGFAGPGDIYPLVDRKRYSNLWELASKMQR